MSILEMFGKCLRVYLESALENSLVVFRGCQNLDLVPTISEKCQDVGDAENLPRISKIFRSAKNVLFRFWKCCQGAIIVIVERVEI